MRIRFLCCALLLVLLSRSTCVTARIADDVVERDGRGIILLAEPFGFGSEGHLELTVSNLELHRSNVDTNLQGFFITSSQVSHPVWRAPKPFFSLLLYLLHNVLSIYAASNKLSRARRQKTFCSAP